MPEPTINLNKGLQALYYFDEQNFDNQRNVMRDHSGYSRHAEANGGPTIGVNGPDSFEATSFDGNDDQFVSAYAPPSEPYTFAVAFNVDTFENGTFDRLVDAGAIEVFTDDNSTQITHRITTVETPTGGGRDTRVNDDVGLAEDRWSVLIGMLTNDGFNRLFFDGAFIDEEDVGTDVGLTENISLGGDSKTFPGQMAFFGWWNRVLSDAEIEALNRLTAPRRAQL